MVINQNYYFIRLSRLSTFLELKNRNICCGMIVTSTDKVKVMNMTAEVEKVQFLGSYQDNSKSEHSRIWDNICTYKQSC